MDKQIPYIVFESTIANFERTIRRLWVLCILLIVLLVGSNIAWIVYESQFEEISVEQEVTNDGDGDTTVNGVGDIYGNKDKTKHKN